MAKITWIGEGEGEDDGPSHTVAFGKKHKRGEPVETRSYAVVQKALGNQFFEVEDADDVDDAPEKPKNRGGRPRKVTDEDES